MKYLDLYNLPQLWICEVNLKREASAIVKDLKQNYDIEATIIKVCGNSWAAMFFAKDFPQMISKHNILTISKK